MYMMGGVVHNANIEAKIYGLSIGFYVNYTLMHIFIQLLNYLCQELVPLKKNKKKLQDVGKYDYGEGFWSQAFTVLRRYADEQELSTEAFRVLSCRLF